MADFHQTGVITSLHRLGAPDLGRLEQELVRYGLERPIALVLPCLYSEIHGPALKRIVGELSKVPYLAQCVLSLSGEADIHEYREMRDLFRIVRCADGGDVTILWNHGPRVQALYARLREEGLDPGADGKGRTNWIAFGYVLATHKARVVATHDCGPYFATATPTTRRSGLMEFTTTRCPLLTSTCSTPSSSCDNVVNTSTARC